MAGVLEVVLCKAYPVVENTCVRAGCHLFLPACVL